MALFEGKAIITVDGKRHLFLQGEKGPEDILLIATDTVQETAQIEVNGQRRALRLGVVTSAPLLTSKSKVTLWKGRQGFFYADGSINGVTVKFLVDTGANTIALNSATARRVGLEYKRFGKRGFASTASGYTVIYNLKLNTVRVGGITLYNLDAGVIEGPEPSTPLLGMSFLGKLDMKRTGDRMDLTIR